MLDRQLLIVSGKGGVGKSAIAASLATSAARSGMRALAIGMVDGLGLGAHLRTERLRYSPTQVQPGLFALAVDRPSALDEYLRLQLRVPKLAPTKQLMRALNVLVDTVPGVRETITIGKPLYELWAKDYDIVIVDAPPLGQLFSYLRAPVAIASMVPTGAIQSQAAAMARSLADNKATGLVLVTTADELPVSETSEALIRLVDEPVIDLVGLIVNRVLPELAVPAATVAGLEAGAYRDAATLHTSLNRSQTAWIGKLPPMTTELPYLFGMLTPGEVAARLADELDRLQP
jgi:anion-transporting  ArsA/GET3 family ATPase